MAILQSMDLTNIARLREEAERDLEALRRVEAMLKRQPANVTATAAASTPKPASSKQTRQSTAPNAGLAAAVEEIVRQSAPSAMRPRDVLEQILAKGFKFSSQSVGASGVSAALVRFVKKGRMAKRKEGYVWIG